jgi:hypothetical protein
VLFRHSCSEEKCDEFLFMLSIALLLRLKTAAIKANQSTRLETDDVCLANIHPKDCKTAFACELLIIGKCVNRN